MPSRSISFMYPTRGIKELIKDTEESWGTRMHFGQRLKYQAIFWSQDGPPGFHCHGIDKSLQSEDPPFTVESSNWSAISPDF